VRIPLVVLLLVAAGCEDIRRFEGEWTGPVSADARHRQGIAEGTMMRAQVATVSRRDIDVTVDWSGDGPLPFQPILHAADDALGELRLEGEPLRTYLGYLTPPSGAPYLAAVSIFSEDRIDVRVIRGPDETYGVFSLRRGR
jgi:hypothetical protein